jgi:predicted aspartyl protease
MAALLDLIPRGPYSRGHGAQAGVTMRQPKTLQLMALLWCQAGLAAPPEQITPPAPIPPGPGEVTTVIVEAPEPLYVAPTLRDRIGRIWAPVVINGKGPYRLVLDTGATSSAIIPSVVESLGIPLQQNNKLRLNGVTGTAMVSFVTADQIEVGELLMQDVRLPVVPDVFGGAQGVLGGNGFRDKRIFIDFGRDLIRIQRSKGERMAEGFTRVKFNSNRLQLPMFDIRIGTVRTKAILDTGAQTTIGNDRLREVLIRRAQQERTEQIIGVTLDVAEGKSISIPPINLGDIQVRNMRANFGSMYIFEHWKLTEEPVLVIGMDVIGTLDTLIIDYKLKEMQLRARRQI